MANSGPRYPLEEYGRRGNAIYAQIKSQVAVPENTGKIVAIDIETGDYEVHEDQLAAGDRLLERKPDAQIWYVRIGYRGVHHFGGNVIREPV